jgi:hypothetical protein
MSELGNSSDKKIIEFTIPDGEAASQRVDLGGRELVCVYVPDEFDGASFTIEGDYVRGGGNNMALLDGDGTDSLVVPAAAGKISPIKNLSLVAGLQIIRLVSSANQSGAAAVLRAVVRPV